MRPATELPTYGLRWDAFAGSPDALRYNRRELANLEAALVLVPGRGSVLQAGGNLGIFPKVLAHHFEAVWTFEPDPDNLAKLRRNAPEKNIVAIGAALGAKACRCTLSRLRRDGKPHAHEGITHVERVGTGAIPMVAIDDFDFRSLDLLYLDIEGHELPALEGAVETLSRCRPVVVVEINKSLEGTGISPEHVRRFLVRQGYTFKSRLGSDEVFVPSGRPPA